MFFLQLTGLLQYIDTESQTETKTIIIPLDENERLENPSKRRVFFPYYFNTMLPFLFLQKN